MRYDFSKAMQGFDITVEDLINQLETINPEAKVTICGDSKLYIHVTEDESVISLDHSIEEDWYYDDKGGYFGNKEDIPVIEPIIFDNDTRNNNLYNIVGIDDLEGTTFGRFTSHKKAIKAKEMIEANGFENMLEIVEDEMPVDTIEINNVMISLL